MAVIETESRFRELAQRTNDGFEVVLLWQDRTGELTVCVSDERSSTYFELDVEPEQALDVFDHPFAHAAFRGVQYGAALLDSWESSEGEDAPVGPRFSEGWAA